MVIRWNDGNDTNGGKRPMILALRDMIAMTGEWGFALPAFDVAGVALARSAVAAASQMDSPVLLRPVRDDELLMPSLVALANRAPVPVVPILGPVSGVEAVASAIRLGAQGVVISGEVDGETQALAEACNVALLPAPPRMLRDGEKPAPGVAWFGDILDGASGPVIDKVLNSAHSVPWSELVELAAKSARGNAASCIGRCGSAGRIVDLVATCRPRREVEHMVLYTPSGIDDAGLESMIENGMATLRNIPGVRRVFAGKALTQDGAHTHVWSIRLAAEAVIDGFRNHPDHRAFAENSLHPIAPDRMSIDFVAED